ncbi:MAG: tRNA (adenosine(37)-N6)-dimethylallyltransferase MiaA, partial [Gemmatimonadota bacterium]
APPVDAVVAVLELDRDRHRERIRRRARRLLERGWKEEVRELLEAGYGEGDPPFTAVGYREVAAVVQGEMEEDEALERIFLDTWSYARRQRTWFRTQVDDDALRLDAARPTAELLDRLLQAWEKRGGDAGGRAAGSTTKAGRSRGG